MINDDVSLTTMRWFRLAALIEGISFLVLLMVIMSLAGPRINPKAFEIDSSMFKLKPRTTALVVVILIILTLIYARFW